MPSDKRIGELVGPYRIESLVGTGGMGQVYSATDADGNPVAVKIVRGKIVHDAVYRKRFEREVRIARQVVDSHVVPVLDCGEHDGLPYFVAPLISGGSLENRLHDEGRLDIEATLGIAAQVAAGLDALAADGIVHRHVKPANIVLAPGGTALLTDLGLARDTKGTALTNSDRRSARLNTWRPSRSVVRA